VNSRQRVLKTLRFEEPDKVPVTLAYETPDDLCLRFGKGDFIGKFRNDILRVSYKAAEPSPLIKERYLSNIPDSAIIDQWGIGKVRSSTGKSFKIFSPLAEVTTIKELDSYPFPDVTDSSLHAHLDREISETHAKGFAVQGHMSQTIFELAWEMVGMEKLLMYFYTNPRFVERLFEIITDLRIIMARRFVQAGVDILRLGDDVGSQTGMLINPKIWRRFLKPHLAKIIQEARKLRVDLPILYHSDGDIQDVIPELIEAGVTILNPIQPECMDPRKIKGKYGHRLTLMGTIGTQTTLPFGTVEEVRNTVAKRCREVGKGGGFIIMPTHTINSDVPWENIVAFYNAVEEFGNY